MTAERSLDIFWLLNQLDNRNFDLWDQLTEEQRKEVSPFVILRWLTGTNDPEQLVALGEVASACLFEFGDKKDLLLKLFAACTVNGSKRYKWVTPKGANKGSSKALQLIALTYRMSLQHATDVRPLFSNDELVALAEAQGWQKDELKELIKECK